jgi:hypothetical protein
MRLIKTLLVAAIVATASLTPAAAAQADVLSRFSFVKQAEADSFFTEGTNVRVSYRCTSRIRDGLIQVANKDSVFTRRARARCDGVPRSVLLRTDHGENTVLLQQKTAAFAQVVVLGRPCQTAACFG